MTDAPRAPLCREDALHEREPIAGGQGLVELVLVRVDGVPRAYENRCPHRGTSLDWAPGRFTSADGVYLQCATHGALFRMEDGVCVLGPCAGDALRERPLHVLEGAVYLGETP
jgi:nitrite reductase/ring-hydroxylating ferredoxin subunit